jgi:hypothetical protein
VVRQKFHLSSCADFRDRLTTKWRRIGEQRITAEPVHYLNRLDRPNYLERTGVANGFRA